MMRDRKKDSRPTAGSPAVDHPLSKNPQGPNAFGINRSLIDHTDHNKPLYSDNRNLMSKNSKRAGKNSMQSGFMPKSANIASNDDPKSPIAWNPPNWQGNYGQSQNVAKIINPNIANVGSKQSSDLIVETPSSSPFPRINEHNPPGDAISNDLYPHRSDKPGYMMYNATTGSYSYVYSENQLSSLPSSIVTTPTSVPIASTSVPTASTSVPIASTSVPTASTPITETITQTPLIPEPIIPTETTSQSETASEIIPTNLEIENRPNEKRREICEPVNTSLIRYHFAGGKGWQRIFGYGRGTDIQPIRIIRDSRIYGLSFSSSGIGIIPAGSITIHKNMRPCKNAAESIISNITISDDIVKPSGFVIFPGETIMIEDNIKINWVIKAPIKSEDLTSESEVVNSEDDHKHGYRRSPHLAEIPEDLNALDRGDCVSIQADNILGANIELFIEYST